MKNLKILGTVVTFVILTLPGVLIYTLESSSYASVIFLTAFTALCASYLLVRKYLGLTIDSEIKKQHSW